MKTIYPLRLVALSSLITSLFLLLFTLNCFSQTESNTPYTRDTLITQHSNGYTNSWWVRITTQKNDATPRPALCFLNGSGEVGTDTTKLTVYGGHYWLNNGWDGSVTLGNGKHYPIIITIMQPAQNQPANQLNAILDTLIKYYPILKGSIHVAGLSEGSWCWGELIQYAAYSGDETAMSKIKSYVNMEGVAPMTNTLGYNMTTPTGFGHWAKKYGGKFLGLEGSADTRNVWQISDNMNDSVPGSAFFSYESDGGGAHCCWNDFYNPATTDLTSANTNINWTYNTKTHPHTMGNYYAPSSIFQWMLRQGDTSLVGASATHKAPVVSAGNAPAITLPVNSVSLSGAVSDPGATIVSYAWTEISGPAQYTFSNLAIINPTVSNLVAGTYVFRLTVTDNFGLSGYSDVSVIVNPVVVSAIPGTVQAESYATMYGVTTETSSDTDGTLDVTGINQADWMNYSVNVAAAGAYTASFRVACASTGAAFQLRTSSGAVLVTINVPNTSGVQTWQTISATVTLPAGAQTLQLYSINTVAWNINWMQFTALTVAAIPGKIEAENYTTMSGVGTEITSDAGGTMDVGWISQGDWMNYSVNVSAAGAYTASFRVATASTGAALQLRLANGTVLTTLTLPNTGGMQVWQTVSANITLPAGSQTIQLYSSAAGWNINWMQYVAGASAAPGLIQAEDYYAMSGIQTQTTTDTGGGLNVGWIDSGDWMAYFANIAAAGTYTASFRVASPYAGGSFQLRSATGTVLATVTIPNTGGFQTWQTVTATVTLPAGGQNLELYSTSSTQWNINWLGFSLSGTAATQATTPTVNQTLSADTPDSAALSTGSFAFYPVPCTDHFTVQINNGYIGQMSVKIVNQAGQTVKIGNYTKDGLYIQATVPVDNLPTGIYFVRVQIGSQWSIVKKLVKR
jgi:hypothetical protein